jgi:hypothetical protein
LQVLRSRLEAFRAERPKSKGIGQPVGGVEREADRESVVHPAPESPGKQARRHPEVFEMDSLW